MVCAYCGNFTPSLPPSLSLSLPPSLSFSAAEMAQEFVDTQIKDNKVVMFSKSYCPFCRMAKTALDQAGAKYATFELDERGTHTHKHTHTHTHTLSALTTCTTPLRYHPSNQVTK